MGVSPIVKMLAALRFSRAATRTLSARTFRSTPAVFEKLPEQPDAFPAGELINEITGANGLRREEIEAQALGLNRFEGEFTGPAGTKANQSLLSRSLTIASSESPGMTGTEEMQERPSGSTCTQVSPWRLTANSLCSSKLTLE